MYPIYAGRAKTSLFNCIHFDIPDEPWIFSSISNTMGIPKAYLQDRKNKMFLLLLQFSSMIHMNNDVIFDYDETVDFFLCTNNEISIEDTKIKYEENLYSKTNVKFVNSPTTVIVNDSISLSFSNSLNILNFQPILFFKIIKLFTVLYKTISFKNIILLFIAPFVDASLLIFPEDYNSVVLKNNKFSGRVAWDCCQSFAL